MLVTSLMNVILVAQENCLVQGENQRLCIRERFYINGICVTQHHGIPNGQHSYVVTADEDGDLLALVTSLAPFIHSFSKYMKIIYDKNYSRPWGYRSKQAKSLPSRSTTSHKEGRR